MSETVIMTFRIVDGIIAEVTESRVYGPGPSTYLIDPRDIPSTHLTERGDIEDAVARVANAAGRFKEELSEEKP